LLFITTNSIGYIVQYIWLPAVQSNFWRGKIMLPLIARILPLFWLIAILLVVRWFHGIASDPRIETIDSSFQRNEEDRINPSPRGLTPSRGFGL
jgi:hypothetical protein